LESARGGLGDRRADGGGTYGALVRPLRRRPQPRHGKLKVGGDWRDVVRLAGGGHRLGRGARQRGSKRLGWSWKPRWGKTDARGATALGEEGFRRPREERAACLEQVRSLRIKTPGLGAKAEQLSGGNQQKIVIGKWLLSEPRLLLLDEPTRGIDVGAKAEIYALIGTSWRGGSVWCWCLPTCRVARIVPPRGGVEPGPPDRFPPSLRRPRRRRCSPPRPCRWAGCGGTNGPE
jgi:hypothetical protein